MYVVELVRKTIHMIRQKAKAVSQITLDDDCNIPESMPDAGMIIQEKGKIEIEEVKTENAGVTVRGALLFFILYMEDAEEGGLYSVKGRIPFEEHIHVESVGDGDSVQLRWMLEDVSAVLINSRKFGVKTVASLEITAEELRDAEVPVEAPEKEGLQIRTCPVSAAALTVKKRDTCRIKDEIILPANKPNIRQIIWQDAVLQGTELKTGEGEILIKGELAVFVLYEGEEEGKPGWLEQILPFTSRVDAAGCQEGMPGILEASLSGCELEAKPDYDGELRVLHADALLELDIRLYREERLNLICDLYSLKEELLPQMRRETYESLLVSSVSKCRAAQRIRTGNQEAQILQLCHSSGEVKVDESRVTDEGIFVEGAVQVQTLYVTSDDSHPMLCLKGSVPFEHLTEVPGIRPDSSCFIHASLDQLSAEMTGNGELEIRVTVLISALVFAPMSFECIAEVQEAPLDIEAVKALPGFLLYTVQSSDTLWDIAKAGRTAPARICELNGISEEDVKTGQKLLLMKEIG